MKKKIIALTMLLISAIWSPAQISNLDTTTTFTNFSQSESGAYIWINGVATNKSYTAIVTNGLTTGDSLATVRVKVNANEAYLQGEIAGAISNTPQQNPVVVSLQTNLWASQSNYLGTVQGVWAWTLSGVTNYSPASVMWSSGVITTDTVPSTLTVLTNGYTNAVSGYLAIYVNPTNAATGDPYILTVNSNTFSGNSTVGLTPLGGVTNITSLSFAMQTNYDAQTLYASALGDNVTITFTNGTGIGDFIALGATRFTFTNTPAIGTDVLTNTVAAKAATNFAYQASSYYPYVTVAGTVVTVQGLTPGSVVTNSGFATSSGTPASFWIVPSGYQDTNQLYIALIDNTGTNAGGMQSLTISNLASQPLLGTVNNYHGEDFTFQNLTLEGELRGAAANQISSNTLAISNLLVTISALQSQLALLTNGQTTNFQYVTGTLLSLTNHTATFTNGVLQGVTTP